MEFTIILLIILIIIITMIMQQRNNKKNMEYQIKNMFGKESTDIDDQLDRLDLIEKLYLAEKNHFSDSELVDDITWDDLNMNHIFTNVKHTKRWGQSKTKRRTPSSPPLVLSNRNRK